MRNNCRMMRPLFFLVVTGLTLTSTAGLAIPAEFQVELSDGQDARITVRSGDVISLTLPIQAVTGHTWIMSAPLPAGLELVAQRREPVDAGRVGGPQRQIEQLRANRPGRYALAFFYRRPWLAPELSDPVAKLAITVD